MPLKFISILTRVSFATISAAIGTTTFKKEYLNSDIVYAENISTKESKGRLIQLQLIFRHGARTPVFTGDALDKISFSVCKGVNTPPGVTFTTSPGLSDVIFAPLRIFDIDGKGRRPFSRVDHYQAGILLKGGECRLGQLTEIGVAQAGQLGKELRQRYHGLIPISIQNIEARSTNVARCLGTLSAMLGSFLDLKISKKALPIVDVRTTLSSKEYMTPNRRNCALLKHIFRENRKELRILFEKMDSNNALDLKKFVVDNLTNEIIENLHMDKNQFIRVHDWSKITETHKNRLSEEELKESGLEIIATKEMERKLGKVAAAEVAKLFGAQVNFETYEMEENNEVTKANFKYAIGMFLKELHDNVFDHTKRKIFLYSGHDTTIIPLLIALDMFEVEWPDYCANIALELWDMSDEVRETSSQNASEEVSDPTTGVSERTKVDNLEVRILYNGIEKKRMTLSQFEEFCSDRLPGDRSSWERECSIIPGDNDDQQVDGGSSATSM